MFPDVPLLTAVKLIAYPTIVPALFRLLHPFNPTWAGTAVLMAALPPALTACVFTRQYGIWIEQASSAVLFGTLASVITLAIMMWPVETGALAQLAVGSDHHVRAESCGSRVDRSHY